MSDQRKSIGLPSADGELDFDRGTAGSSARREHARRRPKLTISGRDRTKLVEGLAKQVALVGEAMSGVGPEVPVHGALCFVDTEPPSLHDLSLDAYPLVGPKRLAKRIAGSGAVGVNDVARGLASLFPAA